jgi:aromatic ring-opening dioxygenase LigB subunit
VTAAWVLGGLVPHPPIIVPEVGGKELAKVERTCRSMRELASRVVMAAPETLVLITPHGPHAHRARAAVLTGRLGGDLSEFGGIAVEIGFDGDDELGGWLVRAAADSGLALQECQVPGLDHGALVPLYYLRRAGATMKLVVLAAPAWPGRESFALGRLLRDTVRQLGRRAAILASGDLSHRLLPGAPAGYHHRGAEFDGLVTEALSSGNLESLLVLEPALAHHAGQCGLVPLQLLAGALSGQAIRPELLSYEGPLGVGYAVAVFTPIAHAGTSSHGA